MPETGDAASSTSTLPTRGAVSLGTIAPPPGVRRDLHLSLTELPDEELIALSKEGDETAFGEFIRREVVFQGVAAGAEAISLDFALRPVRDDQNRVEYLLAEGRNARRHDSRASFQIAT